MTAAPQESSLRNGAAETRALFGGRPAEESLARSTARLEQVIAAAPSMEAWIAEVRSAIQSCALAVEYHFVGLGVRGGTRDQIARQEPRLLAQLERLDAELSRVLIDAWKAKEAVVGSHRDLLRPIEELATALRSLTEREFDLQREAQFATGGED